MLKPRVIHFEDRETPAKATWSISTAIRKHAGTEKVTVEVHAGRTEETRNPYIYILLGNPL
jgi:hypothetical protein